MACCIYLKQTNYRSSSSHVPDQPTRCKRLLEEIYNVSVEEKLKCDIYGQRDRIVSGQHEHGQYLIVQYFRTNASYYRYQCVVVASEYPKLSKSFLIRGFLKRSKDESDHEIIVCVVDDWPHLELRMSQELSPSTEYENILDENAFIRYLHCLI